MRAVDAENAGPRQLAFFPFARDTSAIRPRLATANEVRYNTINRVLAGGQGPRWGLGPFSAPDKFRTHLPRH